MPHASSHAARLTENTAAKLLLVGVALVIASQLWPVIPMCTAIALIAWGTALSVQRRPALLMLAAAVYAPLAVLAVMAQIDLAMRASLAWASIAGLDAAAASWLLYSLARQTGEVLATKYGR
jgi:hypothetical protein